MPCGGGSMSASECACGESAAVGKASECACGEPPPPVRMASTSARIASSSGASTHRLTSRVARAAPSAHAINGRPRTASSPQPRAASSCEEMSGRRGEHVHAWRGPQPRAASSASSGAPPQAPSHARDGAASARDGAASARDGAAPARDDAQSRASTASVAAVGKARSPATTRSVARCTAAAWKASTCGEGSGRRGEHVHAWRGSGRRAPVGICAHLRHCPPTAPSAAPTAARRRSGTHVPRPRAGAPMLCTDRAWPMPRGSCG